MKHTEIKVLFLINGLGSGGAEMMLFRLLGRLNRNIFLPVVITLLDFDSPLKAMISDLGIPVQSVKVRSKYDLGAFFRLFKILKNQRPDILHTQLFAADILGRVMGRMLKIPVIITSIRNSIYGGRFREFLIRNTEKFADRTTIVSRNAAKRFIKRGTIDQEKLQVIYNGLDSSLFHSSLESFDKKIFRENFKLPEEGFLWVAVGSLTKQKGYSILLKAFESLSDGGFRLAIAGGGPLQNQIEAEIAEKGFHDRVIMLGRVDNIPDLMAAADALVLGSLWEGMPGVAMEAMASELPIVATAVGGTSELVVDGETGYLVEAGSPEYLAEAMQKLFSLTEDERKAMGRKGRKRVEEEFHVNKMVKAYEQLYYECLREKNLL